MGNRCPDCEKFVSLEAQEPEVESIEVDDASGEVSASVRCVLACMDCGTEMKETTLELQNTSTEVAEHIDKHAEAEEEYSLDVEESNVEATDHYQTVDRHGKPIKKARYQRHFYGVSMTATVTCSCGDCFDVDLEDSVQASMFDELF
jgi:hypothetical protein